MVLSYQSGALIDFIYPWPLRKKCLLFLYKIVFLCPKIVHMTSKTAFKNLLLQTS